MPKPSLSPPPKSLKCSGARVFIFCALTIIGVACSRQPPTDPIAPGRAPIDEMAGPKGPENSADAGAPAGLSDGGGAGQGTAPPDEGAGARDTGRDTSDPGHDAGPPSPRDAAAPDALAADARSDLPAGLFPTLARGRVAHWRLDETGGNQASDSGPRGHHGRTFGITDDDWRSAKVRNGLNFIPARRSFVLVDRVTAAPISGLSIVLWVNARSWDGRPCLVQKGEADQEYGLVAVDRRLRFYVRMSNGQVQQVSAPVPAVNRWVHVAANYDGQSAQIFIDGNSVARTVAAGRPAPGPAPLTMGGRPAGAPDVEFFDGMLDDVVLYERALTVIEIAIYAAATGL